MDVHDLQVTHGWQSLVTSLLPHQFVAKSGTDGFQKFHDGMILVRLGRGKPGCFIERKALMGWLNAGRLVCWFGGFIFLEEYM